MTPISPMVTIIIPVHNRSELLVPTLQSVVSQSYTSWQAVICDDGSTENIEAIIASFGDSRLIYRKLNRSGIGGTRNKALAMVNTPFFAMLDSDDMWGPDFLAATVTFLQKHPEVGAVQTAQSTIDRNGRKLGRRTKPIASCSRMDHMRYQIREGTEYVLTEPFGPNNLSSMLIRSQLALRIRVAEIPFMEDWDFLIKLCREDTRIAYLDAELCAYRTYPRTHDLRKQNDSFLQAIRMLGKHRFQKPWQRKLQSRISANLHEWIGFNLLSLQERRSAAAHFQQSLRLRIGSLKGWYGLGCAIAPGLSEIKEALAGLVRRRPQNL